MALTGIALAIIGLWVLLRTVKPVKGKTLVDHILGKPSQQTASGQVAQSVVNAVTGGVNPLPGISLPIPGVTLP